MVLANSYPFINSLLDPISEAHDELIELGSRSLRSLPARRSNDSGSTFICSYPLTRLNALNNAITSLEICERVDVVLYTLRTSVHLSATLHRSNLLP